MRAGIYNLADNLTGLTIGEWSVQRKISHKPSSGGNFSVGYEVLSSNGQKGFLKALDYSSAFKSTSPVDSLNSMTSAYIFERDLLLKCSSSRLRYIVKIIDCGTYSLPEDQYPDGIVFSPSVDYMVLELADSSIRSLRQHLTIAEASAVESPIRQETIGFPAHFFARAHNFKPPGRACQPEADSPMRT